MSIFDSVFRKSKLKVVLHLLTSARAVAILLALATDREMAIAQTKIAFLAGVERYEKDGFDVLNYSEDDAIALKAMLEDIGFECEAIVGKGANLDNLNSGLTRLYERSKGLKKEDVVLVFFSGHGIQKLVRQTVNGKNVEKEEPFFCPIDAHKNDTKTLLNMNDVLKNLKDNSASSNNIVLIDACRESLDKGGKGGMDGASIDALTNKINLFFAAQSGHRSWESHRLKQGIFTYYLLEGLRGSAMDQDGEVTLSGLADYVCKRVERDSPELLGVDSSEAQLPNFVQNSRGSLVLRKFDKTSPKMVSPTLTDAEEKISTVRNSIDMQFVGIPAGSFKMGSPSSEPGRFRDEGPQRSISISNFFLSVSEVSQNQYQAVMGKNPSILRQPQHPVESVSWEDAVEFCKRLSEQQLEKDAGRSYRLPTEAEWEYACRAGGGTAYHFGDGSEKLSEFAWYRGNSKNSGSEAVRQKKPNAWGLFDMHGNVYEWCADDYDATKEKNVRGGSYLEDAKLLRSAARLSFPATTTKASIGFRVVMVQEGVTGVPPVSTPVKGVGSH